MAEIVLVSGEVQRTWQFLENLFIHSEEVKKELPKESEKFVGIDKEVKRILADAVAKQYALTYCDQEWVLGAFDQVEKDLRVCEKALNDFMESKRTAFPRFYFVSPADLLDILSNGNAPTKIQVHMPKIFQAIENLELKEEGVRPAAIGMHTNVGVEYVEFTNVLKLLGKVETYMQDVIDSMRCSLKEIAGKSLARLATQEKEEWLKLDPAQVTLLINILTWTADVERAFGKLATNKTAMEEAHKHQIQLLSDLIRMVQGDLTKPLRQKIMCMITMDAHSRDIIDKLKIEKVENSEEFQWQSQLKVYWVEEEKDFSMRIADASF
jgi:dynein heavy chain, axonemal